jgi:hypothetical protein
MPVPELFAVGLVGFSTNCMMVAANVLIPEKSPEKLSGGWGLTHLSIGTMMILVGISTAITNALGDPRVSGYGGIVLVYYGFFWVILGVSLIRGYDLRPIAQIAIPYAIVSAYFIAGAAALKLWSIVILLIILVITFFALWPATHGSIGALKLVGVLVIIMAIIAFYVAFGFIFPGYPVLF